jgi:glycosyltransferase involved in cell wall biosynthesis
MIIDGRMSIVPKVSVLMTMYNASRYLREAIESILQQTFTDYEFIIVDDGSTDSSVKIVESYADPRIRLLRLSRTGDMIDAPNEGLALARGEYIARMDADDVALPHRFEKQVARLDAHPEVGVLGTMVDVMDASGQSTMNEVWHTELPVDPLMIRWRLCLEDPIVQPSIMMRRALFLAYGGYSHEDRHAEDYGLYLRYARHSAITSMDEILLRYRWHGGNITTTDAIRRRQATARVQCHAIREFLLDAPYCAVPDPAVHAYPNPESDYLFLRTLRPLLRAFIRRMRPSFRDRIRLRAFTGRRVLRVTRHRLRSPRFWRFLFLAFWLDPFYIGSISALRRRARVIANWPFRPGQESVSE